MTKNERKMLVEMLRMHASLLDAMTDLISAIPGEKGQAKLLEKINESTQSMDKIADMMIKEWSGE